MFALNIDKLEFNKNVLDSTFNEPIIDGGNIFICNVFDLVFKEINIKLNFHKLFILIRNRNILKKNIYI